MGLILSTPLTLCPALAGRHVRRLEFLDVMLGDRPALTPVESFHQRILAGDADEAQDHAEQLPRERSLSTDDDGVVLKALRLAANDAQRGVVDHGQLERIKSAIKAVVAGLASRGDEDPPPAEGDKGVVGPSEAEDELPRNPHPADIDLPDRPAPLWRGPSAVHRRARPAG